LARKRQRNHFNLFFCIIAALPAFQQDGLTGSAWGDWANYTASPLRAFENELGVQALWVRSWSVWGAACGANSEEMPQGHRNFKQPGEPD